MVKKDEGLVFISYAREDQSWATRLYMDLRRHEINAWLDVRCLGAGANWEFEIRKAIRNSRYFILLISKHSVNKRGFVQKEMKEALGMLEEFPKGEVFLVPVRLDTTEPIDEELRELNWVELNPNYHDGLARILSALGSLKPAPLVLAGAPGPVPTARINVIDKGREVEAEVPLIVGPRASISYTPFRTRKEFLQQFIDRLPHESLYADTSISFYFTIDTRYEAVLIGDDLKEKNPEYITLVFQNVYRNLEVRSGGFSVILSFIVVERTVGVPFESILMIQIPEIGMSIVFDEPKTGRIMSVA